MEREGKITLRQEKETDNLNDRLQRAIKAADQQCRKGRKGNVPFSPEAKRIMGEMRILKLLYWRARLKKDSRRPRKRRIKRIAKKYNYKGNLSIDDAMQIKELMHKTAREYAEFRPKAHEFRQTHLGRIADELAERDGKKAESHFRNLIQREETKTKFRRIKTAERRLQGGGISRVEKDENGIRITITDKEEIENEIARVNKSRLQQANNTPLRQEPLCQLLGEQMNFEKWEEILKGMIDIPEEGVEEGTRLWFNYIRSQKIENIEINWTTKEYFDGWKKMKEDKGSAPGIHFGHMKCIDHESDAAEIISKLALLPLKTLTLTLMPQFNG